MTDSLVKFQVFVLIVTDLAPSLLTLTGYADVLLYLCYLELTEPRMGNDCRAYLMKHCPEIGNDGVLFFEHKYKSVMLGALGKPESDSVASKLPIQPPN